MPANPNRLLTGKPTPLGATWDGLGTNFAVFSANATKIELCLFDPSGRREVTRLALPECTDEVWHGYLPEASERLLYGYRAYGPYEPLRGHRFNPHKLLLDPYAKELAGQLRWSDALFGYRLHSPRADLSFDRRDSAMAMPKAVVRGGDGFTWGDDRPPAVPWTDSLIYEAHVRGITQLHKDIRPNERGTFAALGDPRFINHLLRLGITAIELMPIHAFLQERLLLERGLRNYWGYSTLAFFAPEPTYLSGSSLDELRIAVRRLHSAGIEVILDVVYNHTCEGNEFGPTLSLRGLDNASYYRLMPGTERHYINDTGCGNTLNLPHPRVLQMVLDSLRHWATSYHIDGFRFDLCTSLGREGTGFDPGSGFFDAILQDPVLSKLKLIAEPWDPGPGGYQLGNHPPGFVEWNDRFRDSVRRFWRGEAGERAELAARITGSADFFDRRRRRPWASMNFVASHDGFTLRDAVSYAEKHNEANGENNQDGHGMNFSANWGIEGPTDDPSILAQRDRIARAMLASLFLAVGTPMLLAGDELGRTQKGNNNAYCQDNEISWVDWSLATNPGGTAMINFVAALSALRHAYPILRSDRFRHGNSEPLPGIKDIAWFDSNGTLLSPEAWRDPETRSFALRLAGSGLGTRKDVLLLIFNAATEDSLFELPPPPLPWQVLLDSNDPTATGGVIAKRASVSSHSLLLLGAGVVE